MASIANMMSHVQQHRVVSSKRLAPRVTISDNSSEMFAVRWSPDGKYVAAGAGDGNICLFSADTGAVAFELQKGSPAALPATSLRFRPSADASRTKNVLVSTNAVGAIQHWHVTSGKCLHTIEEKDNQVFALDYRFDGAYFATVGKDPVVKVYDEATKTQTLTMQGSRGYGSTAPSGHSNRVFSVKFHPTDENMLVSGGWDNTVHFWDIRSGQSVRSIFGPHLCGDALDLCVTGDRTAVMTGSWRPESPLEIWDFDTGRLVEEVEWRDSILGSTPCLLYAAQFSKTSGGRFIAAGGSGANEARVFDRFGDNEPESVEPGSTSLIGTVTGMPRGVFSLDWSPTEDKVAIGTGDGSIRIMAVVDRVVGGSHPQLVDVSALAHGEHKEDESEAKGSE